MGGSNPAAAGAGGAPQNAGTSGMTVAGTPSSGNGFGGGGASVGGGGFLGDGLFEGSAVAAVSLTYDDGLDTQLAIVQPALEAGGLRGTFFLSSFEGVDHEWSLPNASAPLTLRHQAWQAAASKGHELASHTVNHPCNDTGKAAGFKLTDYDSARMSAELDDSVARLTRLGAEAPLTFAYPCGSDRAGIGQQGQDFASLVAPRFFAARGSTSGVADPQLVDVQRVPQRDAGGKSGDELRAMVDEAIAARGWLVLLFHGVGEERLSCPGGLSYAPDACMINYLTTSQEAHASLVTYLEQKQAQVWTAPLKQVAVRIAAKR
jgi:peptidoglycan/xylan/chitin deacetylase (PgdA/CDA1 family)